MPIRSVNRKLEIETLAIPQAPGFMQVFARWVGESKFVHKIMTDAEAELAVEAALKPEDLETTYILMPHANSNTQSWHKAKDFIGYAYLMKQSCIDLFRLNGYPFDRDDRSPTFEPKKFMEAVPAEYVLAFWCSYDHTLADQNKAFVVGTTVSLVCSGSYNMSALDRLVKESNGRFSWVQEGHEYVRGNGMSNYLRATYSAEEYDRLKNEHVSGSAFYEVCRFLGLDHSSFESKGSDDDEDDE